MQQSQSEIGRIKAEMELRNAAARYAMYGPSEGSTKHSFITKNMDRLGVLHEELVEKIGEGRAAKFLVKTMDNC